MTCEYEGTCTVRSEICKNYEQCNLRHYELMLEKWRRENETMKQDHDRINHITIEDCLKK